MKKKNILAPPSVEEQFIAFADLSGYHHHICAKLSPEATFTFLSEYYAVAQRVLEGSNGRIVKFIGDAVLIVFPAHDPNQAIAVLRELKTAIDSLLAQAHHASRLCIKAHIGPVAAGAIGTGELERFDVCGLAVNQAALLPGGEWGLSDELQKRAKA